MRRFFFRLNLLIMIKLSSSIKEEHGTEIRVSLIFYKQVLRKEHGIVTSRPFKNYDIPTDRPFNRPTEQQIEMKGYRKVTFNKV